MNSTWKIVGENRKKRRKREILAAGFGAGIARISLVFLKKTAARRFFVIAGTENSYYPQVANRLRSG